MGNQSRLNNPESVLRKLLRRGDDVEPEWRLAIQYLLTTWNSWVRAKGSDVPLQSVKDLVGVRPRWS